jgi:hypothetical protein
MRLALTPKVAAVVEEDTAVAKEDKVVAKEDTAVAEVDKVAAEVNKVVAEVDEGVADEDQREAVASNHRHSTYITMVVKISPNSSPFQENFTQALMDFLDKPNSIF